MRRREVKTLLLPPDIEPGDDLSPSDLEVIKNLQKDRLVAFIGAALLEDEQAEESSSGIRTESFELSVAEISGKKYPVYSRKNGNQKTDE